MSLDGGERNEDALPPNVFINCLLHVDGNLEEERWKGSYKHCSFLQNGMQSSLWI